MQTDTVDCMLKLVHKGPRKANSLRPLAFSQYWVRFRHQVSFQTRRDAKGDHDWPGRAALRIGFCPALSLHDDLTFGDLGRLPIKTAAPSATHQGSRDKMVGTLFRAFGTRQVSPLTFGKDGNIFVLDVRETHALK